MRESQQDNRQQTMRDTRTGAATLLFLVHAWASVVQVVLRIPGTCGREYFGMQAFVGWMGLLFYTGLVCPRFPGTQYVWYSFLGLIPLFLMHRLAALTARRRGARIHSFCVGLSWLSKLLPFAKPVTWTGLECMTCWIGGLALLHISPALGSYVFIAGIANCLSMAFIQARESRQVDAIEDALIEQQSLSEAVQERLNQHERR